MPVEETTTLHGGRLVARRLKAYGVSKLFTLSGGHLFSIYDGCLRAAGERRRDVAIEAAGRRLLAAGADRLPGLRVGRSLYWGDGQVAAAAAAARIQAAAAY